MTPIDFYNGLNQFIENDEFNTYVFIDYIEKEFFSELEISSKDETKKIFKEIEGRKNNFLKNLENIKPTLKSYENNKKIYIVNKNKKECLRHFFNSLKISNNQLIGLKRSFLDFKKYFEESNGVFKNFLNFLIPKQKGKISFEEIFGRIEEIINKLEKQFKEELTLLDKD
jgi:hypothetical protein